MSKLPPQVQQGSSPLARGARSHRRSIRLRQRIIPARAGSTSRAAQNLPRVRDHPRSRGEHSASSWSDCIMRGSSPLARGAPTAHNPCATFQGIIPARAGSTYSGRPGCQCCWDHPRSRGEHIPRLVGLSGVFGSSPLARGARWWCWCVADDPGIIPARAGSTTATRSPHAAPWDHPRSRGEHMGPGGQKVAKDGSSPLARGAQRIQAHLRVGQGIIPARAGSTTTPDPLHEGRWDHPRSRGEHVEGTSMMTLVLGSSPLARGAHRLCRVRRVVDGIIPARAGSTHGPG